MIRGCFSCNKNHAPGAHSRMAPCSECKENKVEAYLFDGKCKRCANVDNPCEYRSEPRGAFGLAGGWCATHDVGWNWCEYAKANSESVEKP